MTTSNNAWAIVLAGGEGSRLHGLTTDASGVTVPKQFCSLSGGQSLLAETLQRAASAVEPERTCVVVGEQHRRSPRCQSPTSSCNRAIAAREMESCYRCCTSSRGIPTHILFCCLQITTC